MSDKPLFNFQVSAASLQLLVKALDLYVERWPGGDPNEQEVLKHMQTELHKAYLDLTFLE